VTEKLARSCGEIDLYLISGDVQVQSVNYSPMIIHPFSWKNFWWTVGIVSLCAAFDGILFSRLALVNLVMVFLLGVTWVAFRYGRRMSILASFLSVMFFDFFFVPPYLTFAVADVQYIVTFVVMLIVGVSIAHLTGQLRRQANSMQLREDRTQIMYALSRDLSKSSYPDELFETAVKHIKDFCKCGVVIFTPDANNKLVIRFGDAGKTELNIHELAVAQWVYEHNKAAGKSTDTLPGSSGLFLPLTGSEKTVGVIGVFPNEYNQFVDPDQFQILEMFVIQTAMAVEGALLSAAALEAESRIVNERIKNMLLTTFSYELSEPLTTISQTASELLKPENIGDEPKRTALIEKMRHEVKRLNTSIAELPKVIESVK
jgi:two-component system sensor histidine kinase KdpD